MNSHYIYALINDQHVSIHVGIFIVVASILIMYYNIGLPNSLRGFLFYSQVSNLRIILRHIV